MNLIPRNKLFDVDSLFEPSLFGNLWPSKTGSETNAFAPRVDVKEKKNTYEITAELPGVKKEDITVSLENGVLSLHAETKQETKEEADGKIIRQERRYGSFYRSFDLGTQVHEGDVQAEFKDGLLKIVAPKAVDPKVQTRKINIL